MEKARAIYDNTIMAERREKNYSGEEYMDRMEIGSSSVDWNFLTPGWERVMKYFCRRAILGHHRDLGIFHISQNLVNAFPSPRDISNPAASSKKVQIPRCWNGKFHGVRWSECYSSFIIFADMHFRIGRTESVGVGRALETQSEFQLTRRPELLTDEIRSNQSCKISNAKCASWFSVKIFSRRWIPVPFSSFKAGLFPKRSTTAHTQEA